MNDWEVWHIYRLVLSGVTEEEARGKVENEKRLGWHMVARRKTDARSSAEEPLPIRSAATA